MQNGTFLRPKRHVSAHKTAHSATHWQPARYARRTVCPGVKLKVLTRLAWRNRRPATGQNAVHPPAPPQRPRPLPRRASPRSAKRRGLPLIFISSKLRGCRAHCPETHRKGLILPQFWPWRGVFRLPAATSYISVTNVCGTSSYKWATRPASTSAMFHA